MPARRGEGGRFIASATSIEQYRRAADRGDITQIYAKRQIRALEKQGIEPSEQITATERAAARGHITDILRDFRPVDRVLREQRQHSWSQFTDKAPRIRVDTNFSGLRTLYFEFRIKQRDGTIRRMTVKSTFINRKDAQNPQYIAGAMRTARSQLFNAMVSAKERYDTIIPDDENELENEGFFTTESEDE
jgi:hypothetical protein